MDVTTIAILQKYVNNALVDNGNVTPEEREKLSRIIIDSTGDMFLADDGTYKTVPTGTTNYDDLDGKPSINSVELDGNKTASQLGFSSVATTGSYNDLSDTPTEITMLSQLINDTGFITNTVGNLLNYYLKTETYNKTEVNSLISNLSSIDVKIVETLPTTGISTSTIYLIKIESTTNYEQWMYIDSAWANIGSTVIDLSNYYNKTETDALLNNKVDKVTGLGLSQNSYTTAEKTKLAGLNNYTLPTATSSILGGVKPDNSTTFVDNNGVLSAVGGASGVIDDNVTSLSKTWSSSKISESINAVGEVANDISIAQKTVNENLSYCISGITSTVSFTPSVGVMIPFIPTVNNGIAYDTTTKLYTLKAGVPYSIKGFVRLYSYSGYFYYTIYDYTNSRELGMYGCMEGATGQNQALFPTTCIIKPTTDIQIGVRIVQINASSVSGMMQNTSFLTIEQTGKAITIDPVNYVNTTQGIEDTPVGHILSQMGKVAPKHYLICDGATYNITDYPYLSQYIKDQFGSFDFFGGDGTTTFAVPDLRGEFLRGTGTATRNSGTGADVGGHQDGTVILNSASYRSGSTGQFLPYYNTNSGATINLNGDKTASTATGRLIINGTLDATVVGHAATITTRPTNTAVLYCIKFEPTYFMSIQGLIEETILFDGDIGNNLDSNVTNNIGLNDSIINYDEIRVYFYSLNGTGRHRDCKIIPKDLLVYVIDTVTTTTFNVISCIFGYTSSTAYTNINSRERGSTYTNLAVSQNQSHVTKVTGVKYKTFQS